DADDLAQDVLAVTVRELPQFQHQRPGGFRAWLRGITVNRLREFWRARRYRPEATGDSDFLARLEQLADPASELSQRWDQDHNRHVIARLMDLVRPQFQPTTWQAFAGVMREGQSAPRWPSAWAFRSAPSAWPSRGCCAGCAVRAAA